MRLMSFLIGFLILGNIALLVWPQKKDAAPHLSTIQAEVNPHFIRLNKEIETRFYSEITLPIDSEVDAGADDQDSNIEIGAQSSVPAIAPKTVRNIAPTPQSKTSASAKQAGVCYRVGPFTHKPNYELAQAVLFNANIEYQKSRRSSKESTVTRLYLGPFKRKAKVEDMRVKLRRAGVLDHFVRKQDEAYIISLGIYSSEQSSNTAMRLFEDKLKKVKRRQEKVVLPESHWLHFKLDSDQSMRRQLSTIDWGEPSAKMGLFDCLKS